MFKRTLVVLEPGASPSGVIGSSLALAGLCRADVVFYTGLTPARNPAAELPVPELALPPELPDTTRPQAEALHALARHAATEAGVAARSLIEVHEHAVNGILQAAHSQRCDAIVVASEGSNALIRLLTGSLVPGLITASPWPVLVCPPQPAAKAPAAVQRMLVMLDDQGAAGAAVAQALTLARGRPCELLLAHVSPSDVVLMMDVSGYVGSTSDQLAAEIQTQSNRLVSQAVAAVQRAGVSARGLSLPSSTLARDLAELATQESCDLIAVPHHGGNAVMRLITGSPIPGLITASSTPLLVCRPQDRPALHATPRRRKRRHRSAAAAAAASAARAAGRHHH